MSYTNCPFSLFFGFGYMLLMFIVIIGVLRFSVCHKTALSDLQNVI